MCPCVSVSASVYVSVPMSVFDGHGACVYVCVSVSVSACLHM